VTSARAWQLRSRPLLVRCSPFKVPSSCAIATVSLCFNAIIRISPGHALAALRVWANICEEL
jgi:hypothetical protein